MVIVKIQGGLGNQLFQYAIAKSLAIHKNTSLYLDLSFYNGTTFDNVTKRNFELNIFNLEYKIAPKFLLAIFNSNSVKNKWLRFGYRFLASLLKVKSFREESNDFTLKEMFDCNIKNLYLDGYWQSDSSFNYFNNGLRKELQVNIPLSNQSSNFLKKINSANAVSIHVRRGDYVTNSDSFNFHGTCDLEYYKEAVYKMNALIESPMFYIFSDDTDWVLHNFNFISNFQIINHNTGDNSFEDLRLMMACKHNIIANSTFSWWAAWLNNYPSKIIFAPKKWFNNEVANSKVMLPPNWFRI